MHALAIPSSILLNKATTIALGCLAGSMIFDWRTLRTIRPRGLDLPILFWCLTPFASAFANGLGLVEGLSQSRYLVLAWGVPYLMGRAYLVDNESFRRFGLSVVVVGLAFVPLGLVEFVGQPFLYRLVYGAHPYQLEGASRYFLYRPLLFSEHGNQFGMWTASAAVCAAWLWKTGRMETLAGIPGGLVTGGLVCFCLICQSFGSVVLAACAIVPLFLLRGPTIPKNTAYGAAALVMLIVIVYPTVADASSLGHVRDQVRNVIAGAGKQSFNWRLARALEYLPLIKERPWLGWGTADWSAAADHAFLNPVNLGLWLLSLGMYGITGLACLILLLTLPIAQAVRSLPRQDWLNPYHSGVTLSVVLLSINVVDALSNSDFLLPVLACVGGLNSWLTRRSMES